MSDWTGGVQAGLFGKRRTAARAEAEVAATEAVRVLQGNCFGCHNPDKDKGGLVLTTREGLLLGGDSGKAVVPRRPEKSRLLEVLTAEGEPHMPPQKQLPSRQIETLRRWIALGVPWDEQTLARVQAPRGVVLEPLPETYRPVQALALDPDGRRLAWVRGAEVLVHDLSSTNYALLHRSPVHADLIRSVAWSPDGRWIATGGFREVRVHESTNFAMVWSSRSNLVGRISALRFSPHGGALVASDGAPSEAGWVRVFESETGRPLSAWKAHSDTIFDLAISADGGLLATAGGDKLLKTWEVLTQKEIARFEGHVGAVLGVALSPTGAELVTVGADKQLKLWDTRTREAVVTVGGRKHSINAVAWSADGSRVAAADEDGQLYGFTDFKRHTGEQSSATATERSLGKWSDALQAVAISRDGKTLVVGGEDGVVRVVSADGKLLGTLTAPSTHELDPTQPSGWVTRVSSPTNRIGTGAAFSGDAPAEVGTTHGDPVPSFVRDVLPVLAKAGCSAGACHAKADGQNGFKLSVFSYDPRADYAEIVKEARGRRVFPASPDESLLLLKSTGKVEHGGGQRIDPGSDAHQLLVRWVRAGMPYEAPQESALVGISVSPREGSYRKQFVQKLSVLARYADGSTRDVTGLSEYVANEKEIAAVDDHGSIRVGSLSGEAVVVARYMGFVDASRVTVPSDEMLPPERYASIPAHNFIDELANAQFRKLGLFPSDLCSDDEFIRRAFLDTIGVLPTEAEVREFLRLSPGVAVRGSASEAASMEERQLRRSELIERLLERPEWVDFWANKWADLLRPNPDRVGVKSIFTMDQWLRDWFRSGRPYDAFAREILLAEGTNHRDGPVVVYRDRREPPELTTLFSQLFLGVRMECAKCHHHPNEKWSQDDFYQFAAVFGPVKQKGAGLSPPISAGTETFFFAPGGAVHHPVTGVVMKPKAPDGPELNVESTEDPRRAFVDWLTETSNPFFARAAVNRVWASFFGRGFVEPVDDFRVSNPASNEPLLEALARDFASNGYDLKRLIRTILESRTYQLSSTPNDYNLTDTRNFSRSYRRRLPAEVLLDAVNDLTGIGDDFNGCPPGTRAIQTWSYKVSSQFMDAFGRPNSSSDCPCERDMKTSVVQALHLMNSRRLHEKLANREGRLWALANSTRTPADIVVELYLAAFSRLPTMPELEAATAVFPEGASAAVRQNATEDVLWALLNSAEFVFNH
jgi:WD40 repeat protein/mono/diheme cytochrome c family protein